jgi:hypothetical protein
MSMNENERLVALVELAQKLDSEGALYRVMYRWSEATGGTTCEVMRCLPVATGFRMGRQEDHALTVDLLRMVLKDLLNKIDYGFQERLAAISDAERAYSESSKALAAYKESLPSAEVRGQAQMEVNKMVDADE